MASDRTDGALTHSASANTNPVVTTPSITSGTAFQGSPTVDTVLYATALGGASGGNLSLAIGPTNSVANTIINAQPILANSHVPVDVVLPAGWWAKLTGTSTVTFANVTVITD